MQSQTVFDLENLPPIKEKEEQPQTHSSKKSSSENTQKLDGFILKLKKDIHEKLNEFADRHRSRDLSLYIDLQADVVSYRQILVEQMYKFDELLAKKSCRIKHLRWSAMEKIKITNTLLKQRDEKIVFIESEVADIVCEYDMINAIITFLNNSIKNIDNLTWAIKGAIDVMFKHGDII